MNQPTDELVDDSTPIEKAVVCLSGFGFACATFFFAAAVLVPLAGTCVTVLGLPEVISVGLILLGIFGLPSIAAILGVDISTRQFAGQRV